MAEKVIAKGREAREYLLEGLKIAYEAVGATAGPKGRNVAIQTPVNSRVRLTKDGVTVARSLELEGFVNEGLKIAKTASMIAADKSGDGTTQTIVLTYNMAKEGNIDVNSGSNPQDLKRGIELAVKKAVEYINNKSRKIQSDDEIRQVTTISANSDMEIGTVVSDAIIASGENGCVEVEDSKTSETYVESIKGYRLDKGYDSPYYSTKTNLTAEYDNPAILVVDGRINNVQAFAELLAYTHEKHQPLVVFAEQFDDLVKHIMLDNRVNNLLQIIPVQTSQFQKRNLEDIAILTGATLITEEAGMTADGWKPKYLGNCMKVKASKDYTTIIGVPEDQKSAIEAQIEKIKQEIKNEEETDENSYEILKMKKRLGYLTDGVHVIRVGGMNETELQEKKDRIDDALHAGLAAREEGIVPGGGTIFLRIISDHVLDDIETKNHDQARGVEIVKRALTSPTFKILENAGERADFVIGTLLSGEHKDTFEVGYDAQNGSFVDMFESGIIDPAQVSRIALESAAKSACDVLTTEIIICDKPKEEKKQVPMQIPMM